MIGWEIRRYWRAPRGRPGRRRAFMFPEVLEVFDVEGGEGKPTG
jgi:hypothetical protein